MCHLNMEETSDGEFEILKGEDFNLESDCMRLACKSTAGGPYLRLIHIQTGCKVILKHHNSKQALLWHFNFRSNSP